MPETTLLSVCPDCGTPFDRLDRIGRCPRCQPDRGGQRPRHDRASPLQRGYDQLWRLLSERARRLQPFCSDCGSPDDLTADHTPAAWARRAAGKPIRLRDIDVVCRRCNAARGAARGERTTERHDAGPLWFAERCPVCRRVMHATERGNVYRHRDRAGTLCPMSGEPWPIDADA